MPTTGMWGVLMTSLKRPLVYVACLFLLSRLLVIWGLYVGAMALPPSDIYPGDRTHLLAPFSRWDSAYYLDIATTGYAYDGDLSRYQNVAFFPVYPLLMSIVAWLPGVDVLTAGVLISHAALFGALYFFYRFLGSVENMPVARVGTALLAFIPFAAFFSLVYTESLFILAFSLYLYSFQKEKYLWAGLAAGVASGIRVQGILLALPLAAWLFYKFYKTKRLSNTWQWLALPFSGMGLGLYSLYLWIRFGSPLLMVRVQSTWNHEPFTPMRFIETLMREGYHFLRVWSAGPTSSVLRHEGVRLLDIWWLCLSILLIGVGFYLIRQRLYLWLALLFWLFCVFTLASGFSSLGRYMVTVLPLYYVAALILVQVRRIVPVLLVVLAGGMVYWAMLFSNWYWIG